MGAGSRIAHARQAMRSGLPGGMPFGSSILVEVPWSHDGSIRMTSDEFRMCLLTPPARCPPAHVPLAEAMLRACLDTRKDIFVFLCGKCESPATCPSNPARSNAFPARCGKAAKFCVSGGEQTQHLRSCRLVLLECQRMATTLGQSCVGFQSRSSSPYLTPIQTPIFLRHSPALVSMETEALRPGLLGQLLEAQR